MFAWLTFLLPMYLISAIILTTEEQENSVYYKLYILYSYWLIYKMPFYVQLRIFFDVADVV